MFEEIVLHMYENKKYVLKRTSGGIKILMKKYLRNIKIFLS